MFNEIQIQLNPSYDCQAPSLLRRNKNLAINDKTYFPYKCTVIFQTIHRLFILLKPHFITCAGSLYVLLQSAQAVYMCFIISMNALRKEALKRQMDATGIGSLVEYVKTFMFVLQHSRLSRQAKPVLHIIDFLQCESSWMNINIYSSIRNNL